MNPVTKRLGVMLCAFATIATLTFGISTITETEVADAATDPCYISGATVSSKFCAKVSSKWSTGGRIKVQDRRPRDGAYIYVIAQARNGPWIQQGSAIDDAGVYTIRINVNGHNVYRVRVVSSSGGFRTFYW